MTDFTLNAELRSDLGKGASRRLRRDANKVPAIVYGGNKEPQSIILAANELTKLIGNEAAFSHVLSLKFGKASESVVIKALQRHPAKDFVMHVDFQRVLADQKLTAHIPIHFINEEISIAVKQQGGEVFHTLTEIEVSCLPKNLPEFIEVDLANVEVGQILHLSDLEQPKGVEFVALTHGNNLAVANVQMSRVNEQDNDEEASSEEDEK